MPDEYGNYTYEDMMSELTPERRREMRENTADALAQSDAIRAADIATGRITGAPPAAADYVSYPHESLGESLVAEVRFWVWLWVELPLKTWWKRVRAHQHGYRLAAGEELSGFDECMLDYTPAQQAWVRKAIKAHIAKYKKAYVAGKSMPNEVDFSKLGLPPFPPTPPLYRRVFRTAIATPAANLTGRLAGWFNGRGQHALK